MEPRVNRPIDRSVRLKVTNDCQWSCDFCHNEGTEVPSNQQKRVSTFLDPATRLMAPVTSIVVGNDSISRIARLKTVGINEVHLTGGEPTLHPELPALVSALTEQGFEVKMTTNGQGDNPLMKALAEAGLKGVNFSILSFDPVGFLATQRIKSLKWAERMIQRGQDTILYTRDLGVPVKINTAVLGKEDFPRVDTVRAFAEEHNIPLVLLPSVGDRGRTEPAVFEYATTHGVEVATTEYVNNAKGSKRYITPGGNHMDAKYLRSFHPESICGGCEHKGKDSCAERFYGLRMEFREDAPYIRMCIQKTNPATVMPLETFLSGELPSVLIGSTQTETHQGIVSEWLLPAGEQLRSP